MTNIEASAITRARPEEVWKLWADAPGWSRWDEDVLWCRLDGPFAAGTRGEMKPRGGPRVKFQILDARPGHGFTDRSYLPLCKLDFSHRIEPAAGGGLRLTHQVCFSGPLAFLFGRVIGAKIRAGLPHAVEKLARLAEGGS